jgi:hypothetical protein
MSSSIQSSGRARFTAIIVLILLVAGITGFIVLMIQLTTGPAARAFHNIPDTRAIPGNAAKFDPVASLPEVAAFAGEGAQLLSIDAHYVRSDGTMELTAENYHPYVEYDFVRPVPTPTDAPPLGAGGNAGGPWYEPVSIESTKPGQSYYVQSSSGNYSYTSDGLLRKASKPESRRERIVPPPKCTFAQLWQTAIQKKEAPKDAVASIQYDDQGYRFNISSMSSFLIWTAT